MNEESFFDPNQVPEELKPAYKQMQAAFTKKTQEAAEIRKQSEQWKQQAETYAKYEQYLPVVEEMMRGQQGAQQQQQTPEMAQLETQLRAAGYSDEAIDMAKILGSGLMNIFNQTQQQKEEQLKAQKNIERLDSQITEAAKVDPRLNDESLVYQTEDGKFTFGDLVERLVGMDPNWKEDPVAATRRAVKQVDALIGHAKTEGKQELSASAKSKASQFPKDSSSPQGARATNTAMSVQEAFQEAKKELGI